MDNQNSAELHQILSTIAPDKADSISNKYEQVTSGINDSLITGKKKIAEAARDQIDGLVSQIIQEGEGARSDLIDSLDQELDLATAALELSPLESAAAPEILDEVSQAFKVISDFTGELGINFASQTYEQAYRTLPSLPEIGSVPLEVFERLVA